MIVVKTKRITKHSKSIHKFVRFLNNNYTINDQVSLYVIDYPCVFSNNYVPALGIFYVEYNGIFIEIANDIEWYYKHILHKRINTQEIVRMILSNIAHEICHYFQHRDSKNLVENWINYHAYKIIRHYYSIEDGSEVPGDTCICAIDPYLYERRKSGFRNF